MIARLSSLIPPTIYGEGDGDDLRSLDDHVIQILDTVDGYLYQIYRVAQSNATVELDESCFDGTCFKAWAGNANFELDRAAKALDEEQEQPEKAQDCPYSEAEIERSQALIGAILGEKP
jgi:hypothetical protein